MYDIIKNDKDTIKTFVDFLMSIDLSEYRPSIFNSSIKNHLREMSKTPFEHLCSVLKSKILNHIMIHGKCIILRRKFLLH